MKVVHLSSMALAALVPIAVVASPSKLNMPVDLALGVIVPVHAHMGIATIISDYCPKVRHMSCGVAVEFFYSSIYADVINDMARAS